MVFGRGGCRMLLFGGGLRMNVRRGCGKVVVVEEG